MIESAHKYRAINRFAIDCNSCGDADCIAGTEGFLCWVSELLITLRALHYTRKANAISVKWTCKLRKCSTSVAARPTPLLLSSSMPPEITTGEREGDKWKSGEKFVQFLIAAEIEVRQIELEWYRID